MIIANLIKLLIRLDLTAWAQSFKSLKNVNDTSPKSRNLISQKSTPNILKTQLNKQKWFF